MPRPFTLFLVIFALSTLAGLGQAEAQVVVVEGVAVFQHFEPNGALSETELRFRERAVRVRGPLVDGDGATEAGVAVREMLEHMDPAELAELFASVPRFDIRSLTVDALLQMSAEEQALVRERLTREGDQRALCAILDACDPERASSAS